MTSSLDTRCWPVMAFCCCWLSGPSDLKRVLLVIFGILFLGVGVAFGTFRGITNRRQ